MNIKSAIYDVLTIYGEQNSNSYLANAEISKDRFFEISESLPTVRVRGKGGSEYFPELESGYEDNISFFIEVYVPPQRQDAEARDEAEALAEEIAKEICDVLHIHKSKDLSDQCISVARTIFRYEWTKPGSKKMPAIEIRCLIGR
jgi:hypothetical protein